jgi:hypothetical protein
VNGRNLAEHRLRLDYFLRGCLSIVRETSVVATFARTWTIRRLATAATAQTGQLFPERCCFGLSSTLLLDEAKYVEKNTQTGGIRCHLKDGIICHAGHLFVGHEYLSCSVGG